VNFLLVLIELLLVGITAEVLRVKTLKIGDLQPGGSVSARSHVKRTFPTNHFCTDT